MKSEAFDELLSETSVGGELNLPYLEIRNGPEDGRIFLIKTSLVCIGRNPNYEIGEFPAVNPGIFAIKTDRSISRDHCRIEKKEDGTLMLKDSDSRYGTQLNSVNIKEEQCHHGDIILIGDTQIKVHTQKE